VDNRRLDALTYTVSVASWLASGLIHFPQLPGSIYSDIVSFWWRDVGGPQLRAGEAPCFQFFLEYPPASCVTLYLSALAGSGNIVRYYQAFFYLSLPAYIAIAWSVIQLSRSSGHSPLGVIFVASPSLVVYGIYNFDHFAAAAAGVSAVLLTRGRLLWSGLAAGLGAAAKIYPALLLPLILLETRGWARGRFLIGFAAGAAPFYIAQETLNPSMLVRFIEYHGGWGLENAWYIWVFHDQFSPTAKLLGSLVGALLVLYFSLSRGPLLSRMFLIVSSWLIMSYVFTPQMVIWLIPLMPAVARLVLPYWPSLEVSNVAIILTWFGDFNPLLPPSPPQVMALIRAASLGLMIYSVYRRSLNVTARAGGGAHPTSPAYPQ